MIYYPIIIPTLNRYQHFKECVESLARCTFADKTELVIGLDYPPSLKYEEGWKNIQKFFPTIRGFAKVTVFQHKQNLGCSKNTACLIDYVFKNYDAYIFTEDDNVFAPSFLDYINKGLNLYKTDKTVLSINAFFYYENLGLDFKSSSIVKQLYNFSGWGYAIWKDRRETIDSFCSQNVKRYVCGNKRNLFKMRHNLLEFYYLLMWPDDLTNRATDLIFSIFTILNKVYPVNPVLPLVCNKGSDGTGLHGGTNANDPYASRNLCRESHYSYKYNLTKKDELYISKTYIRKRLLNEKIPFEYFFMYVWFLLFGYNHFSIKSGSFLIRIINGLIRRIKSLW